jgi:hypothetical protein
VFWQLTAIPLLAASTFWVVRAPSTQTPKRSFFHATGFFSTPILPVSPTNPSIEMPVPIVFSCEMCASTPLRCWCECAVLFSFRPNAYPAALYRLVLSELSLKSYQNPAPSPPAAELSRNVLSGLLIQNSDGMASETRSIFLPAGTRRTPMTRLSDRTLPRSTPSSKKIPWPYVSSATSHWTCTLLVWWIVSMRLKLSRMLTLSTSELLASPAKCQWMGYRASVPICPMWTSSAFDMRSVPPDMIMTWPPKNVFVESAGPVILMLWLSRPTSARSGTLRVSPPSVFDVTSEMCRYLS